MVMQNSQIGRRQWQLAICLTLLKIGSIATLNAQWSTPEPQVDSISKSVVEDTTSAQEPIYQDPLFRDSLRRQLTLLDYSNSLSTIQASEILETLMKTKDLTQFDVVYLPWHRIQIVLMQQYLKHPDSLHMDYLRVGWKDDVEFPESLFLFMRDLQKKQPGVWDKIRFEPLTYAEDFLDNRNELRNRGNVELLSYPDQEYEWALAAALNSLFPADQTVGLQTDSLGGTAMPASIRTQVEAIKAMVSSALWDRVWKDRFELKAAESKSESSESSDESSDEEFEIDPAFGSVPTITALRDSMPFIMNDLEGWMPAENRAMFRQLLPYTERTMELEVELTDFANSAFNKNKKVMHTIPTTGQVIQSVMNRTARNGYEAMVYRDYQIRCIAKEKARVLVLLNDYRECIDRSKYLPTAMPSLLSVLLQAGLKTDSILRVFMVPEDRSDFNSELISNKNDSVSMLDDHQVRNLKTNPTIFQFLIDTTGYAVDTAVSDQPFGMDENLGSDSAHPLVLLDVFHQYEISDKVGVKTVFIGQKNAESETLYDTALAIYWEGDSEYSSNGIFLRGYNAAFEMNYVYCANQLKVGALNSVLRSEGLSEIGMINAQGMAFGISYRAGDWEDGGRIVKNDRFVFAQSSPLVNANLRSTYMIWYDENQISFGRHFVLGVGGYTGYVQHVLKNFSAASGTFINQDQPSFTVVNPAYVYGFSVSPAVNVGNFYARGSLGYGWDFGKKTWNYQGSPMNNSGGLKSTGVMITGEIGYRYLFDFKAKTAYAPIRFDGDSAQKSNKRRVVR
jgi:hypothetical protein